MDAKLALDHQYQQWLVDLKIKIRESRIKASLKVNAEMLSLYWELGKAIVEKQAIAEWGDKIITQLAHDLTAEFKDIKGFSRSSLFNIRKWYQFYADAPEIVQHGVGLLKNEENLSKEIVQHRVGLFPTILGFIPWGHHIQIITHAKSVTEGLFYVRQTTEFGWKRSVLMHHLDAGLYHHKGKAQHNFSLTLPQPGSELAGEILKNAYNLEWLGMTEEITERELEKAILKNISKFLMEMGDYFSFVGEQVHLEVGGQDFYADLVLYHLKLHCYFVIELKVTEFEVEHAGKLEFYITAVDEQKKAPEDNPTIGLLLCKSVNKVVAEYCLKSKTKPMGISKYTHALPKELEKQLPNLKLIEQELQKDIVLPQTIPNLKLEKVKSAIQQLNKGEVKLERNAQITEMIYQKTLLILIQQIRWELSPMIEEFKNFHISLYANGQPIGNFDEQNPFKNVPPFENIWMLGFQYNLSGLKKAGTQAFDIWQNVEIYINQYNYTVNSDRTDIWLDRLYDQLPTSKEIAGISSRFVNEIADKIANKIDKIV